MDNKSTYTLRNIEANLVNFVLQQNQTTLSGVLSFIASHHDYKVTQNTVMKISDDLKTLELYEDTKDFTNPDKGIVQSK